MLINFEKLYFVIIDMLKVLKVILDIFNWYIKWIVYKFKYIEIDLSLFRSCIKENVIKLMY